MCVNNVKSVVILSF